MHPPEVYTRTSGLPSSWEQAILLVDKPEGWTSFDVIRYLRRHLPVRKMGHAGTLDPMATGLLIILVGKATRKMSLFMELDKTYEGTLRLGQETPSYDAETPVIAEYPWEHVTEEDLKVLIPAFTGTIRQRPPVYSALKVKGERLYKKARRGEAVEVAERDVTIYDLEFLSKRGPDVDFRVRCARGTYIRSLAHDIGQALGTGAHLVALRRTAIGPFRVEEAFTPEEIARLAQNHTEGCVQK